MIITSPSLDTYPCKPRELVTLKSGKYEKEYEVEFLKEISGNNVLKLKGIDSINDAFKLVGYSIYTEGDKKDNERKGPGEDGEAPGWEGFTVIDIKGDPWGQVTYFETGSYNQLFEIQGEDETDVYYVPFTNAIIKEIDKEKRLIIIDPPDGLKNLNKK